GLFERHVRVAFDVEGAVAAAGLALAPRQAHVQVQPELVDGERLADDVDAAEAPEQSAYVRGLDAVNLHVPVLHLAAQQAVTHAPADEQSAPARVADGACQPQNLFGDR